MNHDPCFRRLRPIKGTPEAGCHFIGALIGAAGSLVGGMMGRSASRDAADAQRAAADANAQIARETFQQQRADLAPWREAGGAGLNRLQYLLGVGGEGAPGDVSDELMARFGAEDFEADPGYQFRLTEGEKAINRAAAARGMYGNPATVKELARYGQGLASQEYGRAFDRFNVEGTNRFNRLAALSNIGQTATNTTAGLQGDMAQNVMAQNTAGANAAAAGILGGQNAMIQGLTGGTSGIANQYAFNQGLNRMQQAQPANVYAGAQPISVWGYGGR